MDSLRPFPCISAKEHQNGQNLKAAHNHAQGKHQFGEAGEESVVAHGAYQFQTGTDVADAGDHRSKGGTEGVVVHRDQECGAQGDKDIGSKEDLDGTKAGLVHYTTVQFDHVDGPGMDNLADLPLDATA